MTEEKDESLEDLRKELEEERRRGDDLLNRLKYAQADLENFRKRAEREARAAGEADLRGLVVKLLQVEDELELAAKHLGGKGDQAELGEGVIMVLRNLEEALESVGVQKVESVGKAFDPEVHEAVEKVEGGKDGEDVVVEELRPGYTFRGQLIRPSLVKVELALRKAEQEATTNE